MWDAKDTRDGISKSFMNIIHRDREFSDVTVCDIVEKELLPIVLSLFEIIEGNRV